MCLAVDNMYANSNSIEIKTIIYSRILKFNNSSFGFYLRCFGSARVFVRSEHRAFSAFGSTLKGFSRYSLSVGTTFFGCANFSIRSVTTKEDDK
jgi:hypothetical protein